MKTLFIRPRRLTADERLRFGGTRTHVLVYDYSTGLEIPPDGTDVQVSSREHEYTYHRMASAGDILIGRPAFTPSKKDSE